MMTGDPSHSPGNKGAVLFARLLSGGGIILFLMLAVFPVLDVAGRPFRFFLISGNATWVQHFTLWIALIGAVLASYQNKHLTVATAQIFKIETGKRLISILVCTGSVMILLGLAHASADLVYFQTQSPETIGGWFPLWVAQLPMPVTFPVLAFLFLLKTAGSWKEKLGVVMLAITASLFLLVLPEEARSYVMTPAFFLIVVLTFLGMPIYIGLGGAGLLLFYAAGIPVAALPAESYRIITQPVLASIPLFALAGTLLAYGGAPKRLVRLVNAWTGWLPGGAAVATVTGCALFTAITGASGVTILALGGLLLPILLAARQEQDFSLGLLTASGSVGLLFPPSLPVILYGIYGFVAIDRLFLAALAPGVLLIMILAGFSVWKGKAGRKPRNPFDGKEVLTATWAAKGDLLLPLVVIFGLFSGIFTLVETAAITALWALLLETLVHRTMKIHTGLAEAIRESLVLVGALLIVLGLASGLVSYLVDEQIPLQATDWVQQTIHSKYLFLFILNVLLLLVGALMDIYSAIVVFVPLIAPIGMAFGIDPAHLGVIFLANLELGYLTPPVGMNLFFASLRFEEPLLRIWKTVIPFLLIFIIWVLLITYLPQLTLVLPPLFGR